MKLSALILLFFAAALEVAADNKPSLKIVHIGDSYSSGNGASKIEGDGWYGPHWCFRNKFNWGQQAAHKAFGNDFSVAYTNIACSGGVIKDVKERRTLKDVLCSSGSRSPDHTIGKNKGSYFFRSDKCANTVAPQIDAVGDQTDLVFLTLGGNDAGFGDIASKCFINRITFFGFTVAGGSKEDCESQSDLALEFVTKDFSNDFRELLLDITSRMAPDGKIVVVAYPNLALDKKKDRNINVNKIVAAASIKQREVIDKVNNELDKEMVLLYTGTSDSFAGKEAVTGRKMFFGPGPNEDGFFEEFTTERGLYVGSGGAPSLKMQLYHPNRDGHDGLAVGLATFLQEQIPQKAMARARSLQDGPTGVIDLTFLLDVTASAGDLVKQFKTNIETYIDATAEISKNYRIAIASFGCQENADTVILQKFTNDKSLLVNAVKKLVTSSNDCKPALFSGLNLVLSGLSWYEGVSKTLIVVTNSDPLLETDTAEPVEPSSSLTASGIVWQSFIKSVEITFVNLDGNAGSAIQDIARLTGGIVIETKDVNCDACIAALAEQVKKSIIRPVASIDQVGYITTGQSVEYSSEGSFDPLGEDIAYYAWDFDMDNKIDVNTTNSTVEYVYENDYNGFVRVFVQTADGRTSGGTSILVTATENGGTPLPDDCPLNADGYSTVLNADGSWLDCQATNVDLSMFEEFDDVDDPSEKPPTRKPTKKPTKKFKKTKKNKSIEMRRIK